MLHADRATGARPMTISTRSERMTVAEMVHAYLPALLRSRDAARNALG